MRLRNGVGNSAGVVNLEIYPPDGCARKCKFQGDARVLTQRSQWVVSEACLLNESCAASGSCVTPSSHRVHNVAETGAPWAQVRRTRVRSVASFSKALHNTYT